MRNNKILLVDPHSVSHGPPSSVFHHDRLLSKEYSETIDSVVERRLHSSNRQTNWNAVSTRYITNYGLLMLGWVLKKHNVEVEYTNGDYFNNFDDFCNYVLKVASYCDAICFTGTTPQYLETVKIAFALKSAYPDKYLIFGGPHSYFYKYHEEDNPFDLICIGHNIIKTVWAIEELLLSNQKNRSCAKCLVEGYEDVPKDFSLIPRDKLQETLLYSYISYGCPNNCNYCIEHSFTSKVCFLPFNSKLEEILFLVNDAKNRVVHLADSDFFLNSSFTNGFLEALQSAQIDCCFTVNTSPKVVCSENFLQTVNKFYKLGLVELLIGVEYFSKDVLQIMNKHYRIESFFNSLDKVKKQCPNLIVSFYSLIGFPGETFYTQAENYKWFKKFKENGLYDYSFPKCFVPYPGTDIFENPAKYNAKIIHNNWNEYHRWALPRPIKINGMEDSDFCHELFQLYSICGVTMNNKK